MADRSDKFLFVSGLFLYLLGQIGINAFGSTTKDQVPVDAVHWLMLVGVALMIPFAARLPRRGIALVAAPVLLLGVVLTIGMCVLDFVFWSLPDPDLAGRVAGELRATPMVWGPFISYAGWALTIGLGLTGVVFVRQSKIGAGLVVIGALVIGAGPIWTNPPGYAAIILGYAVCFGVFRRSAARA